MLQIYLINMKKLLSFLNFENLGLDCNNEKKITLLSMLFGTGSCFVVAVPVALLIAFLTGFVGVLGQHAAKYLIKRFNNRKNRYYEKNKR
jgi:hypothetical protein